MFYSCFFVIVVVFVSRRNGFGELIEDQYGTYPPKKRIPKVPLDLDDEPVIAKKSKRQPVEKCHICWIKIKHGMATHRLDGICMHSPVLHETCLSLWLIRNPSCPVCRANCN